MSDLDDQVAKLVAEGWRVVASGKVVIPFEAKTPKPSFSERVEGFGGAVSGDLILDDDEQWFQLVARASGRQVDAPEEVST